MLEIANTLILTDNLCESYEVFNYLVKKFDQAAWTNETVCRYQTKQFYFFVKRFLLVDFPLAINCELIHLCFHLINEKVANFTDKYLTLIEKNLKKHTRLESNDLPSVDLDKNIYIQRSINIFYLARIYKSQVIDKITENTKTNGLYKKLNDYLKLEMKLENTLIMFEHGNTVLNRNILAPVQNLFDWTYDQLNDTLKVFIKIYKEGGLRWQSVANLVKDKGLLLKNAIFNYSKNMIEIRVSRSQVGSYLNQFWHEIVQLFNEIRNLEREDIALLTSVMYQQAINSLKIKKSKPSISTI